ncbi:MAG TPA: PDZ domain-containing protein, partial [Parvularculaceae bacterium]|nr:PDZ domain-containing protein [Parvularculaceae bacterium]
CALLCSAPAFAQDQTLLLRDPAISKTHIAFIYAGDLWVADRDGSNPRRLTSSDAEETNPIFSPDGSKIAYSADFENNEDVYVIDVAGGQPKRLTWHPGADIAVDWTPDGAKIAFVSRRETNEGRSRQLFEVPITGGLPVKQMNARVYRGRFDASGGKFAYMAFGPAYNGLYGGSSGWRGYRGGDSPSISIMDMAANKATEISGDRVNDLDPMWDGETLYFLSDRNADKVLNVYRYDAASGAVTQISHENTWDVRAADVADGTIIYESGGHLKTIDLASGAVSEVKVSIHPDLPQLRPQWKDASKTIEAFDISPSGKRVVITARGEIFTVPTDEGSTRNLTHTDGAREYTALWSPDGKTIAYIDAASEAQKLVIESQTGLGGAQQRFDLGSDFNTLLNWGGDGKRIIYFNQKLELWSVEVANGKRTHISTDARRGNADATTSPDGRWLAFAEVQPNFNRVIKLYDFTSGKTYPVTDEMADASAPAFSPDGKYLYFAASTNSGTTAEGLDMSTQDRPYRAGIYVAVLASDGVSPLKPKAGDEGEKDDSGDSEDKDKSGGKKGAAATRIDIDGLQDRIVALPVAEANYGNLAVAKNGDLYFVRNVQPGASVLPPDEKPGGDNALMKFNFKDKSAEDAMSGVVAAAIGADGEHIIVQMADSSIQTGKIADSLDLDRLDTSGMRMFVDPRHEWGQIFDEAWRMEKDFFYDPKLRGLDWKAVYDRYKPLLKYVGRREDLSELLVEMIGEIESSHDRTGGGDIFRGESAHAGLLGADLAFENGRTRIKKIYTGERWNPFVDAPLAKPGVGVKEGDYILAVNGRDIGPSDNIFEALQGASGKQTTLRVASSADGKGARDIVLEPVDDEDDMRLWSWIEANRRAVDKASGGKVGYVYMPNTAGAGFTYFNRMFFAQIDKDAMIIDERGNGGGQAANYIIDVLRRPYLAGWKDFAGMIYNTPGGAIYGPKLMMIDQDAGSGGDFMPYAFRQAGIGKLLGKRTWGGLIGIAANPSLIDGGFLTVPYFRFFDANGKWTVENEGVAPDIDVALDPVAVNSGRDTQLERAIAEVMAELKANPPSVPKVAPPEPTEVGK